MVLQMTMAFPLTEKVLPLIAITKHAVDDGNHNTERFSCHCLANEELE